MRLLEDTMHWMRVRDANPRAFQIFSRHYTFRKWRRRNGKNGKRMAGPGETIVLLTKDQDAIFIWKKQRYRKDGQEGVECSVFRNEGRTLSSVLLQEAEQIALDRWPNCRFFTYVNPKMVQSTNPGYCFKICGWVNVGKSSKGLHILEKANNHLHIGKNC